VIAHRHPVIAKYLRWGGELFVNKTVLLPVSLFTLLWMALRITASEAQTHGPIIKYTQHTVNPLIAPHVNPFLPSAISTVSVLALALISVLMSLEMPVTPSQFLPLSECPPQSRYKLL
ncbi:unnamed protein product, partial [Staurois parvus]